MEAWDYLGVYRILLNKAVTLSPLSYMQLALFVLGESDIPQSINVKSVYNIQSREPPKLPCCLPSGSRTHQSGIVFSPSSLSDHPGLFVGEPVDAYHVYSWFQQPPEWINSERLWHQCKEVIRLLDDTLKCAHTTHGLLRIELQSTQQLRDSDDVQCFAYIRAVDAPRKLFVPTK